MDSCKRIRLMKSSEAVNLCKTRPQIHACPSYYYYKTLQDIVV